MQLYTVTNDEVVIEYLSIQLTAKIEEKARIIAEKGWKFFLKDHFLTDHHVTVVASVKDHAEPNDKYFGSTRIIRKDVDIRKEITLLVNETFNYIQNNSIGESIED